MIRSHKLCYYETSRAAGDRRRVDNGSAGFIAEGEKKMLKKYGLAITEYSTKN